MVSTTDPPGRIDRRRTSPPCTHPTAACPLHLRACPTLASADVTSGSGVASSTRPSALPVSRSNASTLSCRREAITTSAPSRAAPTATASPMAVAEPPHLGRAAERLHIAHP
ncbi:hypothetical protein ACWC0C_40110 [Streptomyces sp. NPDC001709]